MSSSAFYLDILVDILNEYCLVQIEIDKIVGRLRADVSGDALPRHLEQKCRGTKSRDIPNFTGAAGAICQASQTFDVKMSSLTRA